MSPALPEDVFVIVTTDASPIVHWNLSLGRIGSAGAAFAQQDPSTYFAQRDTWFPWLPNREYNTFMAFHATRVTSEMRAEYNAELARTQRFAEKPSRMACLFAWGSLDDALSARQKMAGRFKGTILRCRPASVLRAARCNSALFNFAQRAERRSFFSDQETVAQVWDAYWSGSDASLRMERQNMMNPSGPPETVEMSPEPRWEWLIDGTLDVIEDATPTTS